MKNVRPGQQNLITDVEGLRVGNAQDDDIKSGVTAVIADAPCVAAVHVMGGAPGTRETDLLSPENLVEEVDGIVLSGGSAFGLDAASGAMACLAEQGRGFDVGPHKIPIVPAAILFDLINGGNKDWGRFPPYRELGYQAVEDAGTNFELGSVGAGTGALTAVCKGGLGSASSQIELAGGGHMTIGALVAANPLGSPLVGTTGCFWAAPFEIGIEFGGRGFPAALPADMDDLRIKHRGEIAANSNTTIAVVATDAKLSKSQAKRLAVAAHDGFARAIWPSHTPLDGDLIFSMATGRTGIEPTLDDYIDLGAIAAATMSRAIARGVYHARAARNDLLPSWHDLNEDGF